jgi:phage terminase large subunit GpA-like protein
MPLCPHCEKTVTLESTKKDSHDEVKKEIEGFIKREVMYSCPHCNKVLGFAFFLGGLATGRP